MNMTFQNFVNKTRLTQGMIHLCVIVYMDNILVYSETYHGHAQHIEWKLGALRDAGFKIALEKSEFFLSEISFLGYVVTRGGLRPDSRKVVAVREAPVPTSVTQLTWTRDIEHRAWSKYLELLIIQAWRTEMEGDLIGFLSGSVRPGYRQLIVQELTIPLAQLIDDLPLDIVSQCDESPVPHVLSRALTPYLQWSACLEEPESDNNPPSRQEYLDSRRIIDLAFFQPRTTSEDKAITTEEEEEEDEEGGDKEEEEETPEEGSYSEHREGEQGEEEEEEDQSEEEEEYEWETLEEETDRAEPHEEDPEAAPRREEIAARKQPPEFASGVNLPIPNDPSKDPEPPKNDDGDLAAETSSAPVRWRRSRSPSPSTSARPPVRTRTDAGHPASSPVLIPSSP
ncbi:hypothetical protein CBR_g4748 [Chara braunii]|uniref:Reverse transcriptase domain-containing protein n=1 Tax=Chara braunii TaxID=69332 RepID=A0A388KIN9_CHABU|nr:hypothetical protein CBR_g4748 [Chara braunii]|eukprot:GBG69920.1 hypothetical protein CBR_g4748 [Chara braunii]